MEKNFTTPEQSKRLLELGVPADSADCYICEVGNLYNATVPQIRRDGDASICLDTHLPIWSAGRLIELSFCLRDMPSVSLSNYSGEGLVEMIVQHYEVFARNVDWSKLQ